MLAAGLESLEQLTFHLQDSKIWLTSVETSLNDAIAITDPKPESLSDIHAQISQREFELLSRQKDLTTLLSSAKSFLSCLEKYNSAKVILLHILCHEGRLNFCCLRKSLVVFPVKPPTNQAEMRKFYCFIYR